MLNVCHLLFLNDLNFSSEKNPSILTLLKAFSLPFLAFSRFHCSLHFLLFYVGLVTLPSEKVMIKEIERDTLIMHQR